MTQEVWIMWKDLDYSADLYPFPNFIERPRLNILLDKAVDGFLVNIKAASGYGKTQTILNYLANRQMLAFWFRAKEKHNDADCFWDSVVSEVEKFDKRSSVALSAAGFPHTSKNYDKYRKIIAESIPTPGKFAIVIDDAQALTNPDVIDYLEMVLEFTISSGCLCFVIGRRDCDLDLSEYSEYNTLFEINETELAFTPHEIRQYLLDRGIQLDSDEYWRIYADTQGWPYAINRLSKLLLNAETYSSILKQYLDGIIFDRMDRQILKNVPEEVFKTLLLCHVFMPDIPGYAEELLRSAAVRKSLGSLDAYMRLERDSNQHCFQEYFRSYLQAKIALLTEDEKKQSYLLSLEWCKQKGYNLGVLRCHAALGMWADVYREVESGALELSKAEMKEVISLLESSGEDALYNNPHISYIFLWILTSALGRLGDAWNLCQKFVAFDVKEQRDPTKLALAASGYFFSGVIRMIGTAETGKNDFYKYFLRSEELYKISGMETTSFRGGYHPGATFCRVLKLDRKDTDNYTENIAKIEKSCQAFHGYCGGLTNAVRAEIAYYRHEYSEAKIANLAAIQQAGLSNQPVIVFRALVYQLMIEIHTGNYHSIQALLRTSAAKMKSFHGGSYYKDIFYAVVYSAIHQNERAASWLRDEAFETSCGSDENNYIIISDLVRLKMFLNEKKYTDLLSYIEVSRIMRETRATLFEKIFLDCLTAIGLYKLGKRDEAVAVFRKAYLLAEPGGYDGLFIDFENDMRTLTRFCIKNGGFGIPTGWLRAINLASSNYARKLSLILAEYQKSNGLTPAVTLSPNEKKVLYALYRGYTQSEIASEYSLSPNTIKAIIRMLKVKLNASRQAEFVHHAIELSLIDRTADQHGAPIGIQKHGK
jgi:ATP/maltotriose-dependent transcriptional regulator MalT